MNTPTLITLIIFIIALIWLLIATIRKRMRSNDTVERRILLFSIGLIGGIALMAAIVSLNTFGIGRLPLLNEVRNKIPESFTPADKPVNPSTNGSIQPPSQPYLEDHKKLMEKLKRDGL